MGDGRVDCHRGLSGPVVVGSEIRTWSPGEPVMVLGWLEGLLLMNEFRSDTPVVRARPVRGGSSGVEVFAV